VRNKKNEVRGAAPVSEAGPNGFRALELQDIGHFRQIADNLHVVLALSNADVTEFLYVNRAYKDIWGRAPQTLYANPRSFVDGIHKDDRARFEQALKGLIEGRPISDLECRVVRPEGSITWVCCRGFPVRDSKGRIHRIVGSAQEITQRKLAEHQLRESEDRYRDLVEHSHDLICTHDLDGTLLSVNEAPLRILGYSREELLNRPLRDFVPVEARPHCDAYLSQIRTNGFAKGLLPVRTKSGEVRFWDFNNTIRTEGVSFPVVRGLAHDVTDQKRAHQQLQRSEAILAEGQRLTHTGSWIWNPISGEFSISAETGRIVESEPSATSFERFLQFVHPEDKPGVELSYGLAASEKRDFAIDHRIVLQNGSIKHIHTAARPVFKPSGKFIEFIGIVMDVSERKRSEAELRRLTARLLHSQEKERRKIARDLHDTTGQNLAAVINLLDLIKHSIRSGSQQKSQKLVAECKLLANQCFHETRTLSYVLFPPTLDQAGIESAIRHYLEVFVKQTGIRVNLEASPSLGRTLPEIELALFRVAQESLTNIHRHSRNRTAKIRLDRSPGLISLEISDRGPGKPKQENSRQLTQAPGVGIASMAERVRHLGGVLDIVSSNIGMTVRARVPINES
jgi:PAS domain S-box-containing protein